MNLALKVNQSPLQAFIEIPLSKGKFALIDQEDSERVSRYKWSYSGNGYAIGYVERKLVYLHRFILGIGIKEKIDHRNNNPLDNRKSNLRICSQMSNARHQGLKSNNTSGFKGVSWSKTMNKWEASIHPNYKRIIIGYFEDKIEAAKAYNKAALQYFGEFALPNII